MGRRPPPESNTDSSFPYGPYGRDEENRVVVSPGLIVIPVSAVRDGREYIQAGRRHVSHLRPPRFEDVSRRPGHRPFLQSLSRVFAGRRFAWPGLGVRLGYSCCSWHGSKTLERRLRPMNENCEGVGWVGLG